MSTPSQLVRNLLSAYERRDWETLASLYHPDARLETAIGGGTALAGTELIAVLKRAATDVMYEYEVTALEDLDDSCALAGGRLRYRVPAGGFSDSAKHWIYVFRDELLWRSAVYSTVKKAREAFADHGDTLGIAEKPAGGLDAEITEAAPLTF